MSIEASELHRIISASVRDMLDAYRIQAQAGPVSDKALEEILFRAAHGVVQSFAPYPSEQRAALLPHVVRVLLAAFLEAVTGAEAWARRDEQAKGAAHDYPLAFDCRHCALRRAYPRLARRRRVRVGVVGRNVPAGWAHRVDCLARISDTSAM